MNVLGIIASTARFASEEIVTDADGNVVTHSWILPETAEIIWGGIASVIIFWALFKFGWPQMKKSFAARTERIQKELDAAAADKAAASAEAAGIRQAKGDIEAERSRIMAEAKAQAESLLSEGRGRLVTEVADLEARAQAEIAASRGRVGDELRAEIARLSSAAVDHVVTGSLDDATHQELIENFIARVGAAK
ncbi:MAG: synthase subunit [Actinomycetota bacterium]